jgi:hypothetical protein
VNDEPSRIVGSIAAGVSALLVLLASFGLAVTDVQEKAILAFIAIVGPVVVGFLIRRHVFAPSSVERLTVLPPVDKSAPQVLPEGRGPRLPKAGGTVRP